MKRPDLAKVDGMIVNKTFPPENVRAAVKYTGTKDDLFIMAYPKCGTTWMTMILHLLKSNGEFNSDTHLKNHVTFLEEQGPDHIGRQKDLPHLIKSHLSFVSFAYCEEAKYVLVCRNPFDCCVSCYYHCKGFPSYNFGDGTFEEFFEAFITNDFKYGGYFAHLNSLVTFMNKQNVFLVTYESMKADTKKVIKELCKFLGSKFDRALRDEAFLSEVIEKSSFKFMATKEQQLIFTKRPEDLPFIRKGKVGDYKSHFTQSQYDRVMARFNAECTQEARNLWSPQDLAFK